MWISEFDLNNYASCEQGNFKSGKEKLQIQKYSDMCRWGVNLDFEIRGPQHSTINMCTGHPVFYFSAFVMGLNFITDKDKLPVLSVMEKTFRKGIFVRINQHHAAMQTFCLLNTYYSFYKS